MPSISLSDKTLSHLQEVAALRGVDADVYAEELLSITLAALLNSETSRSAKPYRAMQFSGVAQTGRTAAEIDAELDAARDEWESPR